MSPLHINMTNVFHTGRPRGQVTTASSATDTSRPSPTSRTISDLLTRLKRILAKYSGFIGPGILISIAYMDPGNYSTDVAAGAQFQYKLLFVILISNIFACFLQALACKLGSVTGKDLAQNCREHFPNWLRWALYVLSELAIVSTDLAEIIGGAIALNLLLNLNIIAGVVITAFDVFIILLLYRPNGTLGGIRWFEFGISLLVVGVVVCFAIELAKTPNIDGRAVVRGFIPSSVIFTGDGIFAALGILGATIMPHALFLGSSVALPRVREFDRQYHPERIERDDVGNEYKWQPSIAAIRATLSFSITEIILSLSTFATFVNSAILIVAGAALYNSQTAQGGDLFAIHNLLSSSLAPAVGTIFALALLFSGQSSSIIATIVGQIIGEGFINWKVRPFIRRGITRSIALIPCVVVASSIGKDGLGMALNISQISLSILLPFVSAPLIYLTSSKKVMRVAVYSQEPPTMTPDTKSVNQRTVAGESSTASDSEAQSMQYITMENGWIMAILSWTIWFIITGFNVYLIVMLALGND